MKKPLAIYKIKYRVPKVGQMITLVAAISLDIALAKLTRKLGFSLCGWDKDNKAMISSSDLLDCHILECDEYMELIGNETVFDVLF